MSEDIMDEELHPMCEALAQYAVGADERVRSLGPEVVGPVSEALAGLATAELAWAVRSLLKLAAQFELELGDKGSADQILAAASAAIPALEAGIIAEGGVIEPAEPARPAKRTRFQAFSDTSTPRAAHFDAPAPSQSITLKQIMPRPKLS